MRYLLLLFCVLTLSSGGVEIQSDGRWSLEGISARWNMMTPDWHHTYGIKETIRKLDAARSVLEAKGKKVYFQTFAAPSSSDVMNGNDIGMFERCGDSSLFEEAELFFRRSVLRNSHRDASSDIEVIGLQNDFHSA